MVYRQRECFFFFFFFFSYTIELLLLTEEFESEESKRIGYKTLYTGYPFFVSTPIFLINLKSSYA
jgi:hypothetical protein